MTKLLRPILFLTGLVITWLGLNVGLGGIQTLGWQGASGFLEITDAAVFAVQDNHTRFIAGVWTSVGVLFIAGAFALPQMRAVMLALIAMIFVGGLMRLTQGDSSLLLSGAIAPSLIAELILVPLLGLWIFKAAGDQGHV
ncbi:DUF4345 family protein [Yoonia sp. SS1-5]|uniref:DUF4345 family protein n=1 Tax=Yoonia rhodophyticola TaxID=3137370 RepID=A0AAN0MGK9_9RHOB